jgi:hypothetical protein
MKRGDDAQRQTETSVGARTSDEAQVAHEQEREPEVTAEVTGAYTILRKVVPTGVGNGIGGVVVHPVRIALANGPHGRHVHAA